MIFVIKDKGTDLYYSSNTNRLAPLDKSTKYDSEFTAKHMKSIAQHQLAWSYLEDKYQRDKWHIDPDFREWLDAMDIFKNLEIVEIELNEK